MLTKLGIDYITLLAHFCASTLPAPVLKAGPDWIGWHRVPPRASTTAARPPVPFNGHQLLIIKTNPYTSPSPLTYLTHQLPIKLLVWNLSNTTDAKNKNNVSCSTSLRNSSRECHVPAGGETSGFKQHSLPRWCRCLINPHTRCLC